MIAGLVATAVGDAAPEGLQWDGPGPAIFAALALLVVAFPGRIVVLVSMLLSALFLYGALTVPDSVARLADPTAVLAFVSALVQTVGLVTVVVAGIVVLWPVGDRTAA